MQTIHVLPPDLINQIAAGEVVERPASVLKELIENSLDARASQIDIFLKGGGLEEISILDNGIGMDREDLLLSTVRHATSKIRTSKDLEAISTFGFRGEALSSICSVSEVEIKTKMAEQYAGLQVFLRGGNLVSEPASIAFSPGTQITVRHLFENVPGRRKFMRSSSTELAHCQKTVKELALGNPSVRFSLKHEGRSLGTWTASTREARLQECLKTHCAPTSWQFSQNEAKLDFLFFPQELNLSRSEFYLFVNGRLVRHRPFLAAIRSAFQDSGGFHQEPAGVCFLGIRSDWVDANVHPQKWEIRCLNQENLYQWIYTSLKVKLSQSALNPAAPATEMFSAKRSLTSFPFTAVPHPLNQPVSTTPQIGPVAWTTHFVFCEEKEGLRVSLRESLRLKVALRTVTSGMNQGCLPSKNLLIPVIARLKKDNGNLNPGSLLLESLKNLGFTFEHYGDGDLAVSGCPQTLKESGISHFLTDLDDWLNATPKETLLPFDKTLRWFLLWLENHPHFSELSQLFSLDSELEEFSRSQETGEDIIFIPVSAFRKGKSNLL